MVTFNADSEWRGPTLPIHLARLPVVRSRRRLYQSYFPVFCEFHASDDNTGIGGGINGAPHVSFSKQASGFRHIASSSSYRLPFDGACVCA